MNTEDRREATSAIRRGSWLKQDEIEAAKNEVSSLIKLREKGVFLELYGASQKPHEFSKGSEVFVVTEPASGSLREFLELHMGKIDIDTLSELFFDIVDNVRTLQRKRIPHDPPTLDKVLVRGALDDAASPSIALCTSLTHTSVGLRRGPVRWLSRLFRRNRGAGLTVIARKEMLRRDLRSLGNLLHEMLKVWAPAGHALVPGAARLEALAEELVAAGDGEGLSMKAAWRKAKRLRDADLGRARRSEEDRERAFDPNHRFPREKIVAGYKQERFEYMHRNMAISPAMHQVMWNDAPVEERSMWDLLFGAGGLEGGGFGEGASGGMYMFDMASPWEAGMPGELGMYDA